jgi:hypothetical protein
VRHSQEFLHRLEDVLRDLTGDIVATQLKMAHLRKLTADTTEQQRALHDLEPKVQTRLLTEDGQEIILAALAAL